MAGLWVFLAVALPAVTTLAARLGTIDLAYQVRLGDLMLGDRSLIRVDAFTFTAFGRPWLDQQWGAQVLFALVHRAGGWEALVVLRSVLIGATFVLVYLSARAAHAGRRTSALLALGSFIACLFGLALRPQLLAFVMFAFTVWIVADRDRHPARLWLIPAVVAVWVNVHGSFFLAPLLLGLAWLEERRLGPERARTLVWVAAASMAATLLNPFGPRVWAYVVAISTDPAITRAVTEWAPPTIRDLAGASFFLSATAVAALFARKGSAAWPTLLALAVFFVIGLQAVRGVFWWDLVAPSLVAAHLRPRRSDRETPAPRWMGVSLVTAVAVLAVAFLPWIRGGSAPREPTLLTAPAGVTAELRRTLVPGERIYAFQPWGSWFEYALPDDPVFVDSRIELFPERVWRDYLDVEAGVEGWQATLDRWNVDVVVLGTEQRALTERIRDDAGWRLTYQDADGLVFVRS